MPDTYLINGTDVRAYLSAVQELSGDIAAPPVLQDDFLVPGRTGATPTLPWMGPRTFSIGGLIYGTVATNPTDERLRAAFQDKVRAFMRLAFNGGQPVTLTRKLVLPSGGTLEATATARYLGGLDTIGRAAANAGRVVVEYSLLESFWYASAAVDSGTKTGSFSIDALGDVPTHKVTVKFSGSSATQRLTNTTTGDWVQFAASTTATAAVLDVEQFTALQGATNAIQHVTSGDTNASYYWMTVAPGINTFALTGGGSVQIGYKAAYL
ncbi:MAG: hypothetical protein ABFD96_21870 [Armatimonadia bacterium]